MDPPEHQRHRSDRQPAQQHRIPLEQRVPGRVRLPDGRGDAVRRQDGDGISFYLVDGTATISDGGPGAGLAYANSNGGCGVDGGWLGLGLDVFGNFSQGTNTFGNFGPTTAVAAGLGQSSVVLRGSGPVNNASCVVNATRPPTNNQFPFLDGAKVPNLWTGTTGSTADPATVATSQYRRVRVQITPQSATQLFVAVAITPPAAKTTANPGAFTTVFTETINPSSFPGQRALPATLKLGFGASSGAATDYKGIRNVRVSAITDLAIAKALSSTTPGRAGLPAGTFVPGDQVSFTMTATNNGPTAVGLPPAGVAYVSDDLTSLPLENVTWTCTAAGGATCVTPSGSGSVIRAPWVGPSGGSVTVTATGRVTANAPAGAHTNTAVVPTEFTTYTLSQASSIVQPDAGLGDNNLANNSATAASTTPRSVR